jgi:hypothetical protein
MKKYIPAFISIIFLVSCLPKFTEINDQGFGGGMKVNQIKRSHSNVSEFNLSLESKKDKVVINSEPVKTGLLDSTEFTSVQSNIKKQDVKPNKTVTKLNKIFYPLMPKSVKQKFEKTIKSKSNIFGYQGDNDGMTIGFNMLMYGLIAIGFGFFLGSTVFTHLNPDTNLDGPGCFVLMLVLLGVFAVILGGLIFFISMLVAYS